MKRSRFSEEQMVKLVSVRGAPRYLRSDNASAFVSRNILRWIFGGENRDGADRSREALPERIERELQPTTTLEADLPRTRPLNFPWQP
jgi:hypothetical protein